MTDWLSLSADIFSTVLKLIPLQPQNSPFGFKQLRLWPLHSLRTVTEKYLMPLKPILSFD